jgi:selenocysteine lyase/cysteine desulfurase
MLDHRRDFFDFGPITYLNCAYHGPFPRATAARIQSAIRIESDPTQLVKEDFFGLRERIRTRLAGLLGAQPDEMALVGSATQGIGNIANGLEWRPGDEVAISSENFPSNLFTWLNLRRRGVRVNALRPARGFLSSEEVAAAMNSRTRVLALDWVNYSTGVRINLEEMGTLAHRHGALFVADGTQGAGAIELNLDALPVDAMTAAAYKWLLAPYGTGFLYLGPKIQEQLELKVVSWLSVNGSEDFDALPTEEFTVTKSARRFDILTFLGMYGLDASLEYLEQVGVRAVSEHCAHLLDRLAAGLKRKGYALSAAADAERRSTILCFRADSAQATTALYQKLKSRHIAVSLRQGMIRVSPHLYNGEADMDRLLDAAD